MIRIEVAVAAPLRQTLTYLYTPEEHSTDVLDLVGRRVLVPLGKRRITGYVLSRLPNEDVGYTLKPVLEVLDRQPLFWDKEVEFFRWIADYYHYPIGEVIKTALPAGLVSGSVKKLQLTDLGREKLSKWPYESNPPKWFEDLLKKEELSVSAYKKISRDPAQKKIITQFLKNDFVQVLEQLQASSVKEKEEVCYSLAPGVEIGHDFSDRDESSLASFQQEFEKKQATGIRYAEAKTLYSLAVLANSSKNSLVPQKELRKFYPGASAVIQGLLEKGLLQREIKRVYRDPFGDQFAYSSSPKHLTPEQKEVLEKIESTLGENVFHAFLLHGVTGSGKTEVYLRAAEKTLNSGRDVLVLVPEIALASQLESHFISRFSDLVVILHSGLSKGERYDQWSLAASGRAKIVIGARSAVFAPLKNIGLIVVDEEHDAGYKQDDSFRYQARDLAILRARNHKAVALLGSATPSITSYYHAIKGKYTLLRMPERVGGRSLPKVTILDLRKKKASGVRNGVFSQQLKQALQETLDRKEQSLLLMNRRGFSSTVLCRDCGAPVECRHCHVSLVYHKNRQRLVCHYCGYNLSHKVVCSSCFSDALVPLGFGTERIEEEVHALLPSARIARLDSDTAADRKKFLQILRNMYRREIDILIGTQMIAKGHHFPHVTLVGAVWADGGLNMPDFRAAERTFQLISQVTGRAGRGETPGKVIIQTMQPDHYSIVLSRDHRYEDFYRHEIQIRRMPLFPPYVRLIAFHIQGPDESDVRGTANNLATCCREMLGTLPANGNHNEPNSPEILGPAPAPLDRLCDLFRWQLLMKGRNISDLHMLCKSVMNKTKQLTTGQTRIVVDVDPENMM